MVSSSSFLFTRILYRFFEVNKAYSLLRLTLKPRERPPQVPSQRTANANLLLRCRRAYDEKRQTKRRRWNAMRYLHNALPGCVIGAWVSIRPLEILCIENSLLVFLQKESTFLTWLKERICLLPECLALSIESVSVKCHLLLTWTTGIILSICFP